MPERSLVSPPGWSVAYAACGAGFGELFTATASPMPCDVEPHHGCPSTATRALPPARKGPVAAALALGAQPLCQRAAAGLWPLRGTHGSPRATASALLGVGPSPRSGCRGPACRGVLAGHPPHGRENRVALGLSHRAPTGRHGGPPPPHGSTRFSRGFPPPPPRLPASAGAPGASSAAPTQGSRPAPAGCSPRRPGRVREEEVEGGGGGGAEPSAPCGGAGGRGVRTRRRLGGAEPGPGRERCRGNRRRRRRRFSPPSSRSRPCPSRQRSQAPPGRSA